MNIALYHILPPFVGDQAKKKIKPIQNFGLPSSQALKGWVWCRHVGWKTVTGHQWRDHINHQVFVAKRRFAVWFTWTDSVRIWLAYIPVYHAKLYTSTDLCVLVDCLGDDALHHTVFLENSINVFQSNIIQFPQFKDTQCTTLSNESWNNTWVIQF